MRSLPNLLGLFRILATPLLVWLVLLESSIGYLGAVGLLLLMAISDFADGRIARYLQAVSPLGVFLDTISDKIFVTAALLPLVQNGLLSSWVPLVIIVREFIVSGLRSYAATEGTVIAAGQLGKQKLAIQVAALVWCLLYAAGASGAPFDAIQPVLGLWPYAMGLAVLWTLASAIDYLRKSWPLLRGSWSPRPAPEASSDPPRSRS
jgi:CDP-diacylglycerol--glycerol-3-phosphate 3-phosphatidyltransferase